MKPVETFGKYVLLERLAAGGMAEVYLAKSSGAGGITKFFAIKRILPQYSDNPEFIEMFKEEAKIAVNLNHSNVVSIYDFGVENRQFYLVMDYVEGQNLRQIVNYLKKEQKDFSIDQIVYIIKQVAAGLDHAHRCIDPHTGKPLNITHRDMSPQNIMISFEGEVKVVDFGIAKAESQVENTKAGTIKGKFGYMSPEQAEGLEVDLRTDIFSLGIILWELLAKDRLFLASSEAATLRKIRDCQIPSLKRINPSVPAELERICNKALTKDRGLRYQSASAMHKDLNRFLNTQYPESSPQEFSVFMKSTFSNLFIENRKKQVEYAKTTAFSLKEENDEVTATLTESNASNELSLSLGDEQFDANTKVDLGNLKTNIKPVDKNKVLANIYKKEGLRDSTFTRPTKVNVQTKNHFAYYIKMFSNLVVVIALTGTGYWAYKNGMLQGLSSQVFTKMNTEITKYKPDPSKATPTPIENQDYASKPPEQTAVEYNVSIESEPSGARVFIDGKDLAMITPLRTKLRGNTELRIGLSRQGYRYFEKIEKIYSDGQSVRASLIPLPPMGYVSIDVINGGSSPVVYVDGVAIDQKPPIRLYGIPANQKVSIRVTNPFAGLSAEKVITVGVNEKKEINLILSRQASQ